MKTQNLAVMFTDIVGFTATTSRQTREENARMLRRHDALLLPVVRAFGGRRVKTIGDAYLVVFPSPTNSLLCGMAIQDRLWDYNRRVEEGERIEVRIAVNLGEVRVVRSMSGTDVFGEPVNIAARVEGEAAAGEILFTEALYLAMNRAEIPAEELGYRELKGIPDKIRIYRVARGPYALAAASPGGGGASLDRPLQTPVTTVGAAALSEPVVVADPPYGNVGLARVRGLSSPDPEDLVRRLEAPAVDLRAVAGKARRALARVPLRAVRGGVALVVALLAVGGVYLLLGVSEVEADIEAGRLEEARSGIEQLAKSKGDGDPQVLFLRGRLKQERRRRGQGGSAWEVMALYSRAVAAGSGDALAELERLGSSEECEVRELAARALADSGSRDALPALRDIAERQPEPEVDEGEEPLRKVQRLFRLDGRCAAGDVASAGIRDIEGRP